MKQCAPIRWYVHRVGTVRRRWEKSHRLNNKEDFEIRLRSRGFNQKVVEYLKGCKQGGGIGSDVLESWERMCWKRLELEGQSRGYDNCLEKRHY